MKKVQILVVDDEKCVRDAIKAQGEDRGYEITTAIDEDDAVIEMEKKEYEIVITDMRMKMADSGVTVVKKVKEKYPSTQVIVLTAYAEIQNAAECMQEGAFSYVEKNPPAGDPYQLLFLKVEKALTNREVILERDGFMKALIEAIELCDPYTKGHSEQVANVAREIAKEMGLSEREQREAWLAGIIHDIGKIGIYPQVLNKSADLNYAEFGMIKAHPDIGYRVVSRIPTLKKLTEIVVQHHERYDGDINRDKQPAYPGRVKGDEINILAGIISVADTFDAMTSNRAYRKIEDKNKARKKARDVIEAERKKQFNPDVVDAFIQAFDNGRI